MGLPILQHSNNPVIQKSINPSSDTVFHFASGDGLCKKNRCVLATPLNKLQRSLQPAAGRGEFNSLIISIF